MHDLKLDRLDVVYPGADAFPLAEDVRAVGLAKLITEAGRLTVPGAGRHH